MGAQGGAVMQMTVDDAATEALETDNLALQTMSGGKYVQASPHMCSVSLSPSSGRLADVMPTRSGCRAMRSSLKR